MAVIKFPGLGPGRRYNENAGDDYDYDLPYEDDFIDDDADDALNDMTTPEAAAYRKERKRLAMRVILRGLLAGGVVAAIAALIYYQAQVGTYSRTTFSQIAEVESTSDTQYLMLGKRIVSYSRDGISCMSMDGTQIYNVTFEMQQPLEARAGDVLALADYNGSQIYIFSDTKEMGSVSTSLPIRKISVSENGEVAAIMDDQDTTWIYIYSVAGETIAYFKTTMAQSGYPMDVAISPDGSLVAVSHLLATSDGVDSSIAFYNFGGVGANSVENNVSGFNYGNEIFPYIRYLNDSTCVAVSDSRIAFYTGDEIPQSGGDVMLSSQVIGVWSNHRYLAVLLQDATGEEQYNMKVYGTSGSVVGDFTFSMDYSEIQLAGDRIYMNNAQECMIYTVNGVQKYSGTFTEDVRSLIPSTTSRTRHAVVTDTGVQEMHLE